MRFKPDRQVKPFLNKQQRVKTRRKMGEELDLEMAVSFPLLETDDIV